MQRWLIDQDSSVSSEPTDGQGVWHFDETVNICNTYSMCVYIYIYIWLFFFLLLYIYLHDQLVSVAQFVSLLLLLFVIYTMFTFASGTVALV